MPRKGIGKPLAATQRSETAIVAGIAHATLGTDKLDWLALADDYNLIRDHIAATLPPVFRTSTPAAKSLGGFWLGNAAADLRFNTPSGKAEFSTAPLPQSVCPETDAPFVLQTLRSRSVQHHYLWS